jgi:hypothetical protein
MGAYSLDNANEYVNASYWNGTNWVELARIVDNSTNENNQLNTYRLALPSSVAGRSDFKVRFRLFGSGTSDYAYIDDVRVMGIR